MLAARRQQASAGAGSDVDEELSKYLSDQSTDVTALNCYPLIRKLYIELNTGLPASAAVERLLREVWPVVCLVTHKTISTLVRFCCNWFHICIILFCYYLLQCRKTMDDSETVEDTEKGSLAKVTDDSCTVEFIEIVPLDRASDDYHKLEFIDPVVEVKPEDLLDVKGKPHFIEPIAEVKPEDLQEIKQEPADENDDEEPSCFVKQELTDEYENADPNYSMKQEPAVEYETEAPCFTIHVSFAGT